MKKKSKFKFSIRGLFKAKERTHKELAKISFEKKIAMLFKLQEIAKNFAAARL